MIIIEDPTVTGMQNGNKMFVAFIAIILLPFTIFIIGFWNCSDTVWHFLFSLFSTCVCFFSLSLQIFNNQKLLCTEEKFEDTKEEIRSCQMKDNELAKRKKTKGQTMIYKTV
jgi:hypothetical protein